MTDRIPGLEKYKREPENKPTGFIDRINSKVSIQMLLRDEFNIFVPEDIARSWKTYCPWSWEHPDGGIDKTLRVYSTNTAYCFALHGMITPVRIVQIQRECSAVAAARWLSDRYGLGETHHPYWERMNNMILERETRKVSHGSLAHAAQALHRTLLGVDGFAEREFDERVISAVADELTRLDDLEPREGAVRDWLREAVAKVTTVVQQCKSEG